MFTATNNVILSIQLSFKIFPCKVNEKIHFLVVRLFRGTYNPRFIKKVIFHKIKTLDSSMNFRRMKSEHSVVSEFSLSTVLFD